MLFQARPRANNASFAPPISSKGGTSDARSTRPRLQPANWQRGELMSRSQGVSDHQAGLVTRLLFWFAKRALGRVPRGMLVRAFDPKYLRRAVPIDLYAAALGTVPMHLKELAQLKVALMVGCPS